MAVLSMARPVRHPKFKTLYFRKAIPERLRPKAGMREFKRSLNTSDPRVAKQRYAAVAAQYEAFIEKLEAPAPLAVDAVPVAFAEVTPGDLHALAGDLWRWLLERYAAQPGPPEAFSKMAGNGPWGAQSEPWSGQRYMIVGSRRSQVPASQVGIVAKFVVDFLQAKALHLSPEDHRAFCDAARDAIDGALGDLQRRYRGDNTESAALARYPLPRPNAPKARPKVTITGLIEPWEKSKENVRARVRDDWKRQLQRFADFLGHNDATAVARDDLRKWRDHLRTKGLSAKTINDTCMGAVRAVFNAAEAEGVIPSNPFAGLKIALKKDKTKERPRRPYTEQEAKVLLKAARKRTDALRWLTWLMAYSGGRINELAQLHKPADIQREGRIDYIRITSTTDNGQEIKTGASRRDIPLHPTVIAEGFLKWVAKQPDGPLFRDLPPGRYGKRGDAASKRYGRWQREEVGIKDKRAVAHSWRHRMEDQLRAVEAPDEVADSILGHALRGERGTYGEGPPLRVKAKWIFNIPPT